MSYYDEVLEHHGIQGQKWGVRRFQNADGSFKSAGKKRYYGDSDTYTASNGVKVGAPKNAGVAAFRKVQGSKVGGAVLNGMAKANTAFYGRGKNKKTWERIEEASRKETAAVQESERARRNAKKIAKIERKNEKLQNDYDSFKPILNGLKDKKGRDILTSKDVAEMQKGIQSLIDKNNVKIKELKSTGIVSNKS